MRLCYSFCVVVGSLALVKVAWGLGVKCYKRSTEGTCVPVEQCSTFKELSNKHVLSLQDLNYLRAAQSVCEFADTKNVCCENENIIEARAEVAPECLQDRLGNGHRHNGTYPSETSFIVYIRVILDPVDDSMEYGICGGSLITSQYILTAALCVKDRQYVHVFISTTNLNYAHADGKYPDGLYQELQADDAIVHEEYNNATRVHDIALLQLRVPVDFSLPNSPKPVCIPMASRHLESLRSQDQIVHTFGWGLNAEGRSSDFKRHLMLLMLSLEDCLNRMGNVQQRHGLVIDERNICTANITSENAYAGWGGSPLLYRSRGVWFMKGMVSYGINVNGKSSNQYPVVSTSIQHYGDWIVEKIIAGRQ